MDEKIPLGSGRPPCVVRAVKPGRFFFRDVFRIVLRAAGRQGVLVAVTFE